MFALIRIKYETFECLDPISDPPVPEIKVLKTSKSKLAAEKEMWKVLSQFHGWETPKEFIKCNPDVEQDYREKGWVIYYDPEYSDEYYFWAIIEV